MNKRGISARVIIVLFLSVITGFSPRPTQAQANANLQQLLQAASPAASDLVGSSVAIAGNLAVVGVPQADAGGDNAGAVYIFERSGSSWTQIADLKASDASAKDQFGYAVAASSDWIVVGAPFKNSNAGQVYVFSRRSGGWIEEAKLKATDADAGDNFGASVSVSENIISVGAYLDDGVAPNAGAAYAFTLTNGNWVQEAKFTPTNPGRDEQFGFSVAASGSSILVGAPQDDTKANNAGAAFVFTRSGNTWSQEVQFTLSDGAAGDDFGWSVALAGDTALVGALFRDEGASNAGAAYVFTRSGSAWSQQAKLVNPTPGIDDRFGYTVALSSNGFALVGAPFSDNGSPDAGAAYIYQGSGSTWSTPTKLPATAPASRDFYGRAVAAWGGSFIVASPYADVSGQADAGTAAVVIVPGHDGTLSVTPDPVTAGDALTITVTDADLNADPATAETVTVAVSDGGDAETTTLTETGVDTGIFSGTQSTRLTSGTASAGDGTLDTSDGDTITVIYNDTWTAAGGVAQVSQTVTVILPPTPTPTFTPTFTPSYTPSPTVTPSPTWTRTLTVTASSTWTRTPTWTWTPTVTASATWTRTPTATWTPTATRTSTATWTPTATWTRTVTATRTPTNTSTVTVTVTATPTHTPSATWTPTATNTPSATWTPSATNTPSATWTHTPTYTKSPTPVPTTAVPTTVVPTTIVPTTVVPIPTTAVPIPTTAVPIPTTAVPIPTTAVPIPTTAVPIPTTAVPIPTTAVPIPTTVVPIPTTAVPIPTTAVPTPVTGTDGDLLVSPTDIALGETLQVHLTDSDLDLDPSTAEAYDLTVTSSTGESENVHITETGLNTGVFEGSVMSREATGTTTNNDGTLEVHVGDVISVTYVDELSSTGEEVSITKSVTFVSAVIRFVLVNATDGSDIGVVEEGAVITYSQLPPQISGRAETSPGKVGSVVFIVDGKVYKTENDLPYALYGNTTGGAYYPGPIPIVGRHEFEMVPYSEPNGKGVAGRSLKITFEVVP